MRSVCVFCGSKTGSEPRYSALAEAAGQAIARRGHRLVYGGAEAGLMGLCARAALAEGGAVFGIIPEFLIPVEGAQAGAEIRVTATMAARKAMMLEEADGFLVLPGGAGTLEEVFDMVMLAQLGRHAKPAAFVDGAFWSPLERLLRHVVEAGFAEPAALESLSFHGGIEDALNRLDAMIARQAA